MKWTLEAGFHTAAVFLLRWFGFLQLWIIGLWQGPFMTLFEGGSTPLGFLGIPSGRSSDHPQSSRRSNLNSMF